MAGETIKSEAICLAVTPWSKTSHVVTWLTPSGRVGTVVEGAVRPKSAFLGQYDLNYTCEIVYYARTKGDLHALRECAPLERRDPMREDYAALALAGYFRLLADRFAPQGPDCAEWYETLSTALDGLSANAGDEGKGETLLPALLKTELRVLHLLGLEPEIEAESGAFVLRGERKVPVSAEVAQLLRTLSTPLASLSSPSSLAFASLPSSLALDAARSLGVYYDFHVDGVSDVRRAVLRMIHNKETKR